MSDEMQSEEGRRKSWKVCFMDKLLTLETDKESHYNIMARDTYCKLLAEVEGAKSAVKKTSLQYRRLKRFDVLETGEVKKLIAKGETVRYFLPAEEIFDVIESAHVATGHGGRNRLKKEVSRKYANVTIEMINIFLSVCETCQKKESKKREDLVCKSVLHSEMNSCCQLDLIDMQSQADERYKFIMVYQDHLTNFVLLRPLQSKRAEEIAFQLTDIFLTLGVPCILHSDNGREFVNSVITEISTFWPELKIVHGKPRHSQSQGSVERTNHDTQNMLASWMKDNHTTNWSNGLRFVQFMKNRAFHSGIKQSPYKAVFGIEPRVGLTTSTLPFEIVHNIEDEDELEEVIEQISAQQEQIENCEEEEEVVAGTSLHISLAREQQ
jgi:hypothetical protein